MPTIHLCVVHERFRLFTPVQMGTSDAGHVVGPHPVYDEDLADVEFVLELLGSDGHRVEETEAPADKQRGRKAATCVNQDSK